MKSLSRGPLKGKRKFTNSEYQTLAKKAEIFGKKANVVRTRKDGK